jgi:hypothetical protein
VVPRCVVEKDVVTTLAEVGTTTVVVCKVDSLVVVNVLVDRVNSGRTVLLMVTERLVNLSAGFRVVT